MNYWLLCLPRADLEHCVKVGTFGLSRKYMIENVQSGDKLVCCASKGDWRLIAVGEATSNHYVGSKKIFLKDGDFPDRFDFKASLCKPEADIMTIIDQLSFVTNLAYWAVYFRNGISKLTESDWHLISQTLEN
jgi:predicted RNA-binding protein